MKWIKYVIFLILSMNIGLLGSVINIPADYSSIAEGIFNAVDTDTVLVATGTYYENLNFSGKNIVLASHYLTTGDTSFISQTIIDGDSLGNVVIFNSGETENAKLIGCTITNGYSGNGSGIYIENSSPKISNNIIENNECFWYGSGAGIYLKQSSSHIRNNIIRSNVATYGSGLRLDSCSFVNINDNIICDHITNSGYGVAGSCGMSIGNSDSILIENCLLYDNYVDLGEGDMMGIGSSSVTVKNCTFYNRYNGYSLFNIDDNTKILNSIIWTGKSYQGETFYGDSRLNISYSNVKENIGGEGNILIDPLFDNLITFDLTQQSQCINSGDPLTELDPDNSVADMGWKYYDLSDLGTITGTVTLEAGSGTMESVWLEADSETCFPLSNGEYKLNITPGSYSVTASLGISTSQTIDNVIVNMNETTDSIDFYLNNTELNGIIYVAKDGSGDFSIIQNALDICLDGDTIVVKDGIYNEELYINSKVFNLSSLYLLDGDSTHIENTIIDGENSYRPLYIADSPDTNLVITGLTFQNGYTDTRGGGIYIRYSSPSINNCIIKNNVADDDGGGVRNYYSESTFRNCKINNNDAGMGGGFDNDYSDIEIFDSEINGNAAYNSGGLNNYNSDSYISNSQINYNSATYTGAICNTLDSELILKNSVVTQNTSLSCIIDFDRYNKPSELNNNLISKNIITGNSCVIYIRDCSPVFVNNTIVNNAVDAGSSTVYIYSQNPPYSTPDFYNNIIWNNSTLDSTQIQIYDDDTIPSFYNNLIQYGKNEFKFLYNATPESNIGAYTGNIDSDPLFLDEWNGDYYLTDNSPCIDAGTEAIPDSIQFSEFDLFGNSRIYGTTIDIGVHEWQGVGMNNGEWRINNYELSQNYPNPFNPNTTINFSVAHDNSQIKLVVYNVNGQLVNTFFEGMKNIGKYDVLFDASALNSGVYYYTLEVNGVKEATKKMVLIK